MRVGFTRRARRALDSLKLRLALTGMAAIALSVALTVFLVSHDVATRNERAILDFELGHVEKLAGVLSERVAGLQSALRAAAERLPARSIDDFGAMSAFLASTALPADLFSSVFVVAPDGRVVALMDAQGTRNPHLSVADRAYFKRTRAQRRPVVSEPITSRSGGEAAIIFTAPVLDRQGSVIAIVGAAMQLTARTPMSAITHQGSNTSDPVTTVIADAAGRIISHPDKQWLLRDAKADPRLIHAMAHWMAEGRPLKAQGSARRMADTIVAAAGVPEAGWLLLRSVPAQALLGGLSSGRRQALWLGAGAALAGGLVILLATFVMLRPLRQLEQRALQLLHDERAVEDGWPQARGEIGELSKVFQQVMKEHAASRSAGDEVLAKMRAVMSTAPVGIAFTRLSRFELVSAQFNRMFGYEGDRLVGESTHVICTSEEEHRAMGQRIAAAFAAEQMFDEEIELVRADGSHFWGRRQGAPVVAGDPSAGTIWIVTDITEARTQRERLSWTATHDPLTDLVNRREFESRLAEQLRERRKREISSALFIDLDRFKAVNDNGGHAAGDEMLKGIAAILTQRMRSNDTVARLGGDEFAVLLRGCDSQAAERVAEQIRARVQAHQLAWQGQIFQVGASIGVVQIDDSLDDVAAVMSAADAACYEAKRSGRNAVCSHNAAQLRVLSPATS